MKEFKHLDGWECTMSTTAVGTTPEMIRLALGAADKDSGTGAITPRRDLQQTDFDDIWWVGDRADGGLVAIQLKNALSTEGFSLQTTKNGKGQFSLGFTGHVSIEDQDTMPMVFYSLDADESASGYTYEAVSPVGTENPKSEGWYVLVGDNYRPTTDTTVDENVTYYTIAD